MNIIGDMMVDIKKLFYERIVPEASMGKINALVYYGVPFSTKLVEDNMICKCKLDDNELFIPTLLIKNKELFDRLLTEYVSKAMKFYDNNNFYNEIIDYSAYDEEYMICKEKVILAYLFANATHEDFNNPVSFLKKRIAFLDNHMDRSFDLGYSEELDANINLEIKKDTINNETPSELVITAYKDSNTFVFPKVKFGICDDKVFIYAIQNEKQDDSILGKKINRKLYKIGEGFVDPNTEENPKDITASFLVVLNMAISYFNALGYNKIEVPSILIERWNAKRIATNNMYKRNKINNKIRDDRNITQEMIQSNLTNKLLRTFLRLGYHYNNIEFVAFPYELDQSLHVEINNDIDATCNNKLLGETNMLVRNGISDNYRK